MYELSPFSKFIDGTYTRNAIYISLSLWEHGYETPYVTYVLLPSLYIQDNTSTEFGFLLIRFYTSDEITWDDVYVHVTWLFEAGEQKTLSSNKTWQANKNIDAFPKYSCSFLENKFATGFRNVFAQFSTGRWHKSCKLLRIDILVENLLDLAM